MHRARTLHCGWSIIRCNGLSTRETEADILPQSKRNIKCTTREYVCPGHAPKAVCDLWRHVWWCHVHSMGQADYALFTRPFLSSWVYRGLARETILLRPPDLVPYSCINMLLKWAPVHSRVHLMVWRVGGFWLGTVRITMSFACINTHIDSKCAIHCMQVSSLVMIQYHAMYGNNNNNHCVTHLNIYIQEMRSYSNGKSSWV